MGKFENQGKIGFIALAITSTTIATTCYFGLEYLTAIFVGSVIGALPALLFVLLMKSPTRQSTPAAVPAPTKVEVATAAQPGSDFYVPTPADFGEIIKTNVVDNRKEKALILARALVEDYGAKLAATPQTSTTVTVEHKLLSDHQVRSMAHEILQRRGWNLSSSYDGRATLSPLLSSELDAPSPAEITSIQSSSDFTTLLEEQVHKPLKKQALAFAQEIVEGYKKRLEEETHTSTSLTVTVDAVPDYWVAREAREILAQKGWSITHMIDRDYLVTPVTPGTSRGNGLRGIGIFV